MLCERLLTPGNTLGFAVMFAPVLSGCGGGAETPGEGAALVAQGPQNGGFITVPGRTVGQSQNIGLGSRG